MSFAGKWKMVDSQNFDEFMKAVGVGLVMRKAGAAAKPMQEFVVDGDQWTLKTTSTFKSTEIQFQLGQEFDETTADGRRVKTTVTLEGNKLIMTQKGDPDSVLTRELSADGREFVMTLEAKGVTATRKYVRE